MQMVGHLKVAYQNVGVGLVNIHAYLQRCFEKSVQIAFVGECWKNKEGTATTTHPHYKVGSRIIKESRIIVHCSSEAGEKIKEIAENTNTIGIEIGQDRIVRVYRRCKSMVLEYTEWIGIIGNMMTDREGVVVGDWNAHHEQWSLTGKGDGRGRALEEWATGTGFDWVYIEGETWESDKQS